ncbi:MAG: hypothetical protein HY291_07365 [Planctomycetes bacterium]|nr:hypothetical protein [Planctomycetota bacterium]
MHGRPEPRNAPVGTAAGAPVRREAAPQDLALLKAARIQKAKESSRKTACVLFAIAGALFLGVLVPTLLTAMHTVDQEPLRIPESQIPYVFLRFLVKFLVLVICAAAGCGPGAALLAGYFLYRLMKHPCTKEADERAAISHGAKLGALFAFFNLPGFLALVFLYYEDFAFLRVLALFMITGATCGGWIGWQAYRAHHLERGFFPRFTLGTLVSLALGWGALLVLFGP